MSVKAPGKGGTAKHTGTRKHHASHKHHPSHHRKAAAGHHPKAHHVARHPHHAKARGYAVGDLLPVCAFEALAMSLRLAGQPVSEDDLMALWHASGARQVSIGEALAAAALFGLAGCRPFAAELVVAAAPVGIRPGPSDFEHALYGQSGHAGVEPGAPRGECLSHALILGINVPGPHCVLATPRGWWSWGELHDPWPATVEEAWAVSWS